MGRELGGSNEQALVLKGKGRVERAEGTMNAHWCRGDGRGLGNEAKPGGFVNCRRQTPARPICSVGIFISLANRQYVAQHGM